MAGKLSFVGGMFGGALAGVTAGLLLAPKAGNVTRRFVRIKGNKYVKTARERMSRDQAAR